MMSDFAERKDLSMSASYTSHRRILNTRHVDQSPIARRSYQAEAPFSFKQSKCTVRYGNDDDESDSNTARFDQLCSLAYSEMSTDSSSIHARGLESRTKQHLSPLRQSNCYRPYIEPLHNFTYANKPLPDVPSCLKQQSLIDSAWEEQLESSERQNPAGSAIQHRGFSFVPGDGYERLQLGRASMRAIVQALEEYEDGQKA